jgi:hypothetical protein
MTPWVTPQSEIMDFSRLFTGLTGSAVSVAWSLRPHNPVALHDHVVTAFRAALHLFDRFLKRFTRAHFVLKTAIDTSHHVEGWVRDLH